MLAYIDIRLQTGLQSGLLTASAGTAGGVAEAQRDVYGELKS